MIDGTFCCILMESIRVWGEKKVLNLLTLLKSHLYSGERDTFSESWNLGLTCNRGEGGHLGSQRVTHHKEGSYLRVYSNLGEQGMAQWWERSPPTNVARVRILASTPYVGWVCCWFSPFSGYSGFPLSLKTNTSKFQFDLERTDTFQRVHMNSLVLRG